MIVELDCTSTFSSPCTSCQKYVFFVNLCDFALHSSTGHGGLEISHRKLFLASTNFTRGFNVVGS